VIWQNSCLCVEERASDLAELFVCRQCASDLADLLPVPVIWLNCLNMEEFCMIRQNCLSVDSVAV